MFYLESERAELLAQVRKSLANVAEMSAMLDKLWADETDPAEYHELLALRQQLEMIEAELAGVVKRLGRPPHS